MDLSLIDVEGGGKADNVVVGRLSEEAILGHLKANIPSGHSPSLDLGGLDDDSIKETTAANGGDEGRVDVLQVLTEDVAHLVSILSELLLPEDIQGGHPDPARQRVAPKGRAVLARLDGENDLRGREDGRDGVCASRESLAQNNDIRLGTIPLNGKL
jgi:hypothetical protein